MWKLWVQNAAYRLLTAALLTSMSTMALLWISSSPTVVQAATPYYISPSGDNGNSGLTADAPFKTFAKAFSVLPAGGELILLDGTYSEAQGTGYINWQGSNSGQIPSGISRNQMTYVHALNAGKVKILGQLFVGRSFRKDSYIRIEGITFDGGINQSGGSLYNTSYVMIKNCGFKSESQGAGAVLGIGSNDGEWGNSYDLLEDIWVWGKERVVLIIYRSDHIVVRRAVTRHDGCYSSALGCGNNTGNSIVGTTIYNSNNVSFQNVLAVDNIRGPNGHGGAGDFYTAWHDNFIYPWHHNEWLGTISLNSGLDSGYGYDLDNIPAPAQPMATFKDIVAWDVSSPFNVQINCGSGCAAQNLNVSNATLWASNGDGFRIADNMSAGSHVLNNLVVLGTGRFGVNSVAAPAYVNVNGVWSEDTYNQAPCTVGCRTSDPLTDGSLKYLLRIENGSPLKGAGLGGADYGANVIYRYGADGSFWGEAGYNSLTGNPLWPWPNDAQIKQEMCADSGQTRGFCSAQTLTKFIWEYLGNPCPAEICGDGLPFSFYLYLPLVMRN